MCAACRYNGLVPGGVRLKMLICLYKMEIAIQIRCKITGYFQNWRSIDEIRHCRRPNHPWIDYILPSRRQVRFHPSKRTPKSFLVKLVADQPGPVRSPLMAGTGTSSVYLGKRIALAGRRDCPGGGRLRRPGNYHPNGLVAQPCHYRSCHFAIYAGRISASLFHRRDRFKHCYPGCAALDTLATHDSRPLAFNLKLGVKGSAARKCPPILFHNPDRVALRFIVLILQIDVGFRTA